MKLYSCRFVVFFSILLCLSCNRKLSSLRKHPEPFVHGYVAPGFEEVKTAFIRNFKSTNEIGASVCVYHKGIKVVDLWGGYRDEKTQAPWTENTMAMVFSTTKGVCALAMNLAYSRGYFDYDDKVSRYWPEFAQNGKENITIRQLLNHEAGVVRPEEPFDLSVYDYPDSISKILAAIKPLWKPGQKHGYHLGTMGSYMNEVLKRTDPKHRSIGKFIREELCVPLGAQFYIGLPPEVPDSMIATVDMLHYGRAAKRFFMVPGGMRRQMLIPGSLFKQSLRGVIDADPNSRDIWRKEIPSGNGISNARNLARLYSEFSMGGPTINLKKEALAELTKPAGTPPDGPQDVVLGINGWYSLGFMKPGLEMKFGINQAAFGWPGAGGSFAFADPDNKLAFAYVMNYMDVYPLNLDPREVSLNKTVYNCIKKLK